MRQDESRALEQTCGLVPLRIPGRNDHERPQMGMRKLTSNGHVQVAQVDIGPERIGIRTMGLPTSLGVLNNT